MYILFSIEQTALYNTIRRYILFTVYYCAKLADDTKLRFRVNNVVLWVLLIYLLTFVVGNRLFNILAVGFMLLCKTYIFYALQKINRKSTNK